MRKLKLFKTLLVAAGLTMGASAWADNIYTQDYESDGATADWTTGTGGRFTPVILEDENGSNHFLSVDQSQRNNNGCTLTSTSLQGKVAEEKDFTMLFDVKIGSSTNQTPVEFNIYDAANSAKILALVATGTYATTYTVNNNSEQKPAISAGGGKGLDDLAWMSFKLSRKSSLTYLTITNKATGGVVFERAIINTLSEKGGIGKMEFITKRYNANFAIDNVVVRDIEEGDVPASSVYTITTKYQLADGTQVKEDRVTNVTEGDSFNPVYDTTFDDDNYRYTYVSGANSIASVFEDATITIIYTREALAEHTVNFKTIGDIERTLATVTVKDAKSYTFAYPRYLADGTNLYQIVKSRYDQGFQNTASNVSSDVDRTETFNKLDGAVAFFAEAEDIATLTISSTNNNIPARCSGGNAAYAGADAEITTLAPGKYTITAAVFGNNGTNFVFKNAEAELFTITTAGYELEATSDELTFTKETTITLGQVGNGGSSPKVIDYILIKRVGDATVSVPVGTTGFATYANHDFALDFTNVSGLTAFTATVNGNEVTFTPATKVPAGTGVLLKGATADVPVIASAEAISDNILYAPTTNVTGLNYDADGYYNFILTQPAGKKIGFYRANDNSVAAGKAYLRVSQAGSRQFTFIGLDGETTTGIEAINTTEQKNGEVYNLQGQRMAKTQKGLYIVNGKKVIMK